MNDDRTAELLEQLAHATAELVSSDRWAEYLSAQARFHNYSMGNVLLILLQRPDATRVAGFQTWKSLGRSVRKGEHGLRILAPMTYKRTTEDPTTGEDVTRVGVRGFRSVAVFDVSQTDGADLPDPLELLTGDGIPGAFERLADIARALGFTVTMADHLNGANGVTSHTERTVEILSTNDPAQQLKTMAHELGHVLLHGEGCEYRARRELLELEAESVAYVVCATLGLDSSDYSLGYVAHWTGDHAGELIRAAAGRIRGAALEILGTLEAETVAA